MSSSTINHSWNCKALQSFNNDEIVGKLHQGQAPSGYDSLADALSGDFAEGANVLRSMGSSPDIKKYFTLFKSAW